MKLIKKGYIVEVTEDFISSMRKTVKQGTIGVVVSKNEGFSSHLVVAKILTIKCDFHRIPVKLLRIKLDINQTKALQLQEVRRIYEEKLKVIPTAPRTSFRARPRFSYTRNS